MPAGERDAQVVVHASIGPRVRPHIVVPGPAGLLVVRPITNGFELEDLPVRPSLVARHLVRLAGDLVLELCQHGGQLASTCALEEHARLTLTPLDSADHEDRARAGTECPSRERRGSSPPPATRGAERWLLLDEARQGLVVEDPRRAHNSPLFRQPITTLDDHLARGLRVEALAEIVEGYARRPMTTRRSPRARTSSWPADPATAEPPRLLRLRGARPHDVGAPRRDGAGGLVSDPDLLLQQRLGDPRPGRAGLAPRRLAGARLRAGGRRADRHAGARPGRSARARRRSAGTSSSTTGAPATSSARRRRCASAPPRARTSPPPSVHGWSPPTSWPMPARAMATISR